MCELSTTTAPPGALQLGFPSRGSTRFGFQLLKAKGKSALNTRSQHKDLYWGGGSWVEQMQASKKHLCVTYSPLMSLWTIILLCK